MHFSTRTRMIHFSSLINFSLFHANSMAECSLYRLLLYKYKSANRFWFQILTWYLVWILRQSQISF